MKKYVGLDIGGTKCAAVIGTLEGEAIIEKKQVFATEGKTPDEILSLFCDFIDAQNEQIYGIGIACGGPLDSKSGTIKKPPSLPLWDNIKVVEYFEKKYNVPTFLRNDADACAVAEWKYGAGENCENMIFLTFGTGLGAGLILNGRLYSGTCDGAGEIGHVRLAKNGPVGYNKEGSCEGFCSGGGIRRLALIELEKYEKKGIEVEFVKKVGSKDEITAKTLAIGAMENDWFCKKIYEKSGKMFGKTLSILIDLFNPEKIVVGGVFMRSGHLLLPHAMRVLKKEALPFALERCEILPAKLAEKIGDVSALAIAKGDL